MLLHLVKYLLHFEWLDDFLDSQQQLEHNPSRVSQAVLFLSCVSIVFPLHYIEEGYSLQ